MKKELHPTYYPKAKITCGCGNKMEVGSTKEKIEVEICSACHPFYTGKKQLVDTAGRAERFEAKRKKAAENKKVKDKVEKEAKKKKDEESKKETKTEKLIKKAQEKLN